MSRRDWNEADVWALWESGWHVFPIGADKRPYLQWRRGAKDYVAEAPTEAEVADWIADRRALGWAVLLGGPMRGVVLDVEAAGMATPEVVAVLDSLPPAALRPTPSGGRHGWIGITDGEVPASTKLAYGAAAGGLVLLAEVRGHGGYALVLGHGRGGLPAGFAAAPMARADLDALLAPIRDLDESPPRAAPKPRTARAGRGAARPTAYEMPADPSTADFIGRAVAEGPLSWIDVLDEGWTDLGADLDGRTSLLRPDYGSPPGSAASANGSGGVLVVFSTSVPWMEHGRGTSGEGASFSAAEALAASRYRGDLGQALRAVEHAAKVRTAGGVPRYFADWPADLMMAINAARADRGGGGSNPGGGPSDDDGGEPPPMLPASFWEGHERLEALRDTARGRLAPPDATLLAVLVRVALAMPPSIVLPSVVGADHGSLNLFGMPVGRSADGKALADSVARFLVPDADLHTWPLGSGEGVVSAFYEWVDVGGGTKPKAVYKMVRDTALLHDPEGSGLRALAERSGSTIVPALLKAAHGQEVGHGNSTRDRSRPSATLAAGTYRLGLLLEVQPDAAGFILDLRDRGLPQRLVALSAHDPDKHQDNLRPLSDFAKTADAWEPPAVPAAGLLHVVAVPRSIVGEVVAMVARSGAEWSGGVSDELAAHRPRMVLGVAAAVGAWCRPGDPPEVTAADFALAGQVLDTSAAVLAWLYARGQRRAGAAGRRRTAEAVDREVKVSEARDRVSLVAKGIYRHLAAKHADGSHCSGSCARRGAASSYRDVFPAALAHAEARGWIQTAEVSGGITIARGDSAPTST